VGILAELSRSGTEYDVVQHEWAGRVNNAGQVKRNTLLADVAAEEIADAVGALGAAGVLPGLVRRCAVWRVAR